MNIIYTPIGCIHSPYMKVEDMPIQPTGAINVRGKITLFDEYITATKDLEGFSHIYLIYHFHKVTDWLPLITPFLDDQSHGLFSTRAPKRPNPIGLSVVKLLGIDKNTLLIENVDILDGTPVLDIKPYVPAFDQPESARIGWLEGKAASVENQTSDERFKN
ncbi:MAG TPA: tRNA (N6-threonylcarbamoyladenosine(37)-N6)-methyltransferase TrmO [Anaerolineaceae bacterium]|nr:tRNA (N6-threonylcarbamoyladenosine(37)-N6)-methyltransferase TrmO [Anaerolineaceae bacterium]